MFDLPKFKIDYKGIAKGAKIRSIGVLTSGGDAPGMNAAVRAVVRFGLAHKLTIKGILKGYSGLLSQNFIDLNASSVANIIQRGGTILKTDRCDDFLKASFRAKAALILRQADIDGLVVIGGDGTFAGAHLLEKENHFPVIGVPGTIDNDVYGTDDTIGFDTAVNTGIEAIDRIRDTASSHDRIFLVEVMGRNSGYIALQVGIGGGAETVVIPEMKQTVEEICGTIDRGIRRGKTSSIIVVAESPKPGLANRISGDLKKKGYNSRVCILGHTQRGGSPTAHDRALASVLGAAAVGYLLEGKSNAMVGVREDQVVLTPFKNSVGHKKKISTELLVLAKILAA